MIKWLRKRKEERERQRYRDGFGWAMTAFYVEGFTVKGINLQIDIGAEFDGYGQFESGASYAVRIICENLNNEVTHENSKAVHL